MWQRHIYKGPTVNIRLLEQIHHEILDHGHMPVVPGIEPEGMVREQSTKGPKAE
jgi:hypothetical protein